MRQLSRSPLARIMRMFVSQSVLVLALVSCTSNEGCDTKQASVSVHRLTLQDICRALDSTNFSQKYREFGLMPGREADDFALWVPHSKIIWCVARKDSLYSVSRDYHIPREFKSQVDTLLSLCRRLGICLFEQSAESFDVCIDLSVVDPRSLPGIRVVDGRDSVPNVGVIVIEQGSDERKARTISFYHPLTICGNKYYYEAHLPRRIWQ